ncbi:heat shock protein 15 [bacterium BMS3Bbin10]|nr:heat shock protein 15 [bacterium BMS3Bbin10]
MTLKPESKTLPDVSAIGNQRLDKWLWHARVARTRTLSARLVETGKVRVNRAPVRKPGRSVSAGDVLTLTIRGRVRVLKVLACGRRRGPAAQARELYEDLSPPPVKREKGPAPLQAPAQREKGSGRPTKRDRRRIDSWLSENEDAGE